MDLHDTKDRVAIALAESIFRRARYQIRPFHFDGPQPRFGREDFSPNFYVTSEDGAREFLIDVSYRPFVDQFIALENQRRGSSIFMLARRHWPTLYFVLVTDHPEPGRSSFQTVAFGSGEAPLQTVNLIDVREFEIFPRNVEDHEELLLRIFVMLSTDRHHRVQSQVG